MGPAERGRLCAGPHRPVPRRGHRRADRLCPVEEAAAARRRHRHPGRRHHDRGADRRVAGGEPQVPGEPRAERHLHHRRGAHPSPGGADRGGGGRRPRRRPVRVREDLVRAPGAGHGRRSRDGPAQRGGHAHPVHAGLRAVGRLGLPGRCPHRTAQRGHPDLRVHPHDLGLRRRRPRRLREHRRGDPRLHCGRPGAEPARWLRAPGLCRGPPLHLDVPRPGGPSGGPARAQEQPAVTTAQTSPEVPKLLADRSLPKLPGVYRQHQIIGVAIFAVAACLILPRVVTSLSDQSLMNQWTAYSIAAIGFYWIFGLAGRFAFCQTFMMLLGGYISAWVTRELGPQWFLLGLVAAIAATAVFAALIGLATARTGEFYFAIATLAVTEVGLIVFPKLTSLTGADGQTIGILSLIHISEPTR